VTPNSFTALAVNTGDSFDCSPNGTGRFPVENISKDAGDIHAGDAGDINAGILSGGRLFSSNASKSHLNTASSPAINLFGERDLDDVPEPLLVEPKPDRTDEAEFFKPGAYERRDSQPMISGSIAASFQSIVNDVLLYSCLQAMLFVN
jgi:hypothetical protein